MARLHHGRARIHSAYTVCIERPMWHNTGHSARPAWAAGAPDAMRTMMIVYEIGRDDESVAHGASAGALSNPATDEAGKREETACAGR